MKNKAIKFLQKDKRPLSLTVLAKKKEEEYQPYTNLKFDTVKAAREWFKDHTEFIMRANPDYEVMTGLLSDKKGELVKVMCMDSKPSPYSDE